MKLLVYSSVYPPDPASVGQHIADVIATATCRGHKVRIITANRGYDDPSIRFPSYELRHGAEIIRLGWSSFGKKSYAMRLLGQFSFTFQGLMKGITGFHPDVLFISTSPPFGIVAAWLLAKLRGSSLVYWVMDINPDEAIAMGLVRCHSFSARFMECMNRTILRFAKAVITLDSHMVGRLELKIPFDKCISVVPPWPHEDIITKKMGSGLAFRKEHGLDDKFVVMYSGNHSWVHPLDTLLDAANKLVHRKDILFLFVGGGVEKKKVERAIQKGAPNILSLPYQSFENLGESLSAADVHVVVMGEAMVGIVHPCKIYGAMTVRRPLLAIAPDNSHISDIIDGRDIGFRLRHGDVGGVVQAILTFADMDKSKRDRMGDKAEALVRAHWNQAVLREKVVDILERSAD